MAMEIAELFLLLSGLFLVRYAYLSRIYHRTQLSSDRGNLPPRYPDLLPYLGNLVSFVWSNAQFLAQATSYAGKLTSVRVVFFGWEIYTFQDRETVSRIWKQGSLASPIAIYQYVFKYFFGMSQSQIAVYRADDSGPCRKPHANSKVADDDRIDYMTLESFHQAFSGPALVPTTRRFMDALVSRVEELQITDDWMEIPDLLDFFHHHIGASLIESIFGPTLLRLNPTFIDDMWAFDDNIPWLARAVPSWIMPGPYRIRERLVGQFKRWYAYAREHFHESCIYDDRDGDPYWGSNLTRTRQNFLPKVKNHDDDMLARTDMGLVWGAVGNTVPSSMMALVEIIKDPDLVQRVRDRIQRSFHGESLTAIDPKSLSSDPLLSSIYAETLRLYVKTYFMVSSPHEDVNLGRWMIPKGKIGLLNAGLSHMDANFWNTKNGRHAVESFWADRFLTYKSDPSSGPINPCLREASKQPRRAACANDDMDNEPEFSMAGTEGSWFPYGGEFSTPHLRVVANFNICD
ncbi:Pfs, NACHT and ankyrin domain protein [Xylaria flabelliformis]|nr:Pfs, NACHT and ankyrin domain protein [Xylaria flabelliformis]